VEQEERLPRQRDFLLLLENQENLVARHQYNDLQYEEQKQGLHQAHLLGDL
jgi:hypothetical protein